MIPKKRKKIPRYTHPSVIIRGVLVRGGRLGDEVTSQTQAIKSIANIIRGWGEKLRLGYKEFLKL